MANLDVLKSKVTDKASQDMLLKAQLDSVETCFDRMDMQKTQCGFGKSGVCCRNCHMGPCRIAPRTPKGICGADADTIVARNYLRQVVNGTAAHSDHARHLVLLLKRVAEGHGNGYYIKDRRALERAADQYAISLEGRTQDEIALELARTLLTEFTSQEEFLKTTNLAPLKRQGIWEKLGLLPMGIDRMVVEGLHRTTMGVDHDSENIMLHVFRSALADGWGGSRIASMVSDILFGSPAPVRSRVNLGVLKADTVNILIHGHEPELSEMLTVAVQDPQLQAYAHEAGARGITLAGICCTANEILMRHGVPVAGSFLQQELAIVTGAVETMVIDVQCCMPSLPAVAKSYHTEIISTAPIAKTVGASYVNLDGDMNLESARALVRRSIANFAHRDPAKVSIPDYQEPIIAGFSVDAIKYMLGGRFRASFRPLNDAIIQNRITGVVGIVGCNNPKSKVDDYTNVLTKELIAQNVLVLKTGCAAIASGKAGMLKPEIGLSMTGPGLREICEAVGIPPILHMGSCVDNSRILEAATEIVHEGGLGDDISMIPAVGVAPEWMSEKAITIGCYLVASGIDVILGHPFYVSGSESVTSSLQHKAKEMFGASFHVCPDPLSAAQVIMELLNQRRERLGINKKAERKLYDMKDRRNLDV